MGANRDHDYGASAPGAEPDGVDRPRGLSPEIFVYATKKNFLNVYDALRIAKIKLEVAGYDPTSGKQTGLAGAWLDVDDARLLAHLVTTRLFPVVLASGEHGPRFEKFGGSDREGAVESRVLLVEWDPGEGNRFVAYPYRITISNGPGQRNANGAVQPKGEPTRKQSMRLPEADLMKILLAVQAYIQAHEATHHLKAVADRLKEQAARQAKREETAPAAAPPRPANVTPLRALSSVDTRTGEILDPAPPAAPPVPARPAMDPDIEINPLPCSAQQVQDIVNGFNALKCDTATRTVWLQLYNVRSANQLSVASATQLHRQLQNEYKARRAKGQIAGVGV